MRKASFLGLMGIALGVVTALPASAGVPECNNIRFEGLTNCEVRISGKCSASCSELGIYNKSCATKLQTVCSEECTLSADATCTDGCTTQCKTDCDNGVNVICSHNCFAECTVERDASCSSEAKPDQCRATWDANCDAECTSQCVTVDGGCYQHCIECCGGSCTADANMDCQTSCQEVEFQDCEKEFRANCDASCSGDGALFCNGEYMISGSQLPACLKALAAQGFEVKVEVKGEVTLDSDGLDAATSGLCAASPAKTTTYGAPLVALAAAAGWLARRRKRGSRTSA